MYWFGIKEVFRKIKNDLENLKTLVVINYNSITSDGHTAILKAI